MPKDLATQNTGSGRGGAPRRACLPRGGAAVAAALRQIDERRFRPQPSHRLYKLAPESAASESSVLSAHLPPRSGRSCLFPFLDSRELRPGAAEMAAESCVPQPLFGGAISSTFPARFQDASNIREVPDHQEVLVDPSRDESLIFELLDLKGEVDDAGSALWFLRDIANEQDAGDSLVIEHSGTLELAALRLGDAPAVATTAVAQLAVSKARQGREAQNIVRLYLANIRLKNAATDVLISAYEPMLINPLSESTVAVPAGPAIPAEQAGCLPMSEVFKLAVMNFNVHDWNLFNGGP